jgi:hypothetical protein
MADGSRSHSPLALCSLPSWRLAGCLPHPAGAATASPPSWSALVAPGPGAWHREREHFRAPGTALASYLGTEAQLRTPASAARFRAGDTRGWALEHALGTPPRQGGREDDRYQTSISSGAGGGAGGERRRSQSVSGVNWSQDGPAPPPLSLSAGTTLGEVAPFLLKVVECRTLFELRPWAEDLRCWEERLKPDAIAAHHALQRTQLEGLSSLQLEEHLEQCCANSYYGSRVHFGLGSVRLGAAFGTPLNDFVASCFGWLGDRAQGSGREAIKARRIILDCVAGYSCSTVIATSPEAIECAQALLASVPALAILEGCPATDDAAAAAAIGTLRGRSDVGQALDSFVELVGFRLTDSHTGIATAPYLLETPATLVRLLRSCVTHVRRARAAGASAAASPVLEVSELAASTVRAMVPPTEQGRFDALLAEARSCYQLRDERVNYGDAWVRLINELPTCIGWILVCLWPMVSRASDCCSGLSVSRPMALHAGLCWRWVGGRQLRRGLQCTRPTWPWKRHAMNCRC